jgi:AcrR family transcriptional regulator
VAASRRTNPASRAQRESALLRIAGAIFAERGFHAASMDEIADRAGVSKPVVYSHFGSKERLYFACIEAAGRDLLDAIVAAERVTGDGPPEDRLRAGARAFFSFVDAHRTGFIVLYGELGARGAPFRREVTEIRRRIVRLVQTVLDDAVRERAIDAEAIGGTDALAQAVVGAGESLANWWLEHPDDEVDAVTDRLMGVCWSGLESLVGR